MNANKGENAMGETKTFDSKNIFIYMGMVLYIYVSLKIKKMQLSEIKII